MPRTGGRTAGRCPPIPHLVRRLRAILRRMRAAEAKMPLDGFGPEGPNARNLLHYLALRHFDLRRTQGDLADLGLSSLGRAEAHARYNVETVLACLAGAPADAAPAAAARDGLGPEDGRRFLARNSTRLFGRPRPGRDTRIMVTMPSEAATDAGLVRALVEGGMDCMRVNCAHDGPAAWAGMIANLRRAERATGRPVRVEMDLGGPRLRTGPLEPGPAVVKVRPPRDDFGRVVRPARVRWRPPGAPDRRPGPFEAELEAPAAWLARRRRGDRIRFRDARGATRSFRVTRSGPGGVDAELEKTAYLTNGLSLEVRRGRPAQADRAVLSGVPSRPGRVRLAPGSTLRLLAQSSPPRVPSARAGRGPGTSSIGVSIPSVLRQVRRGHRIWFDGGRIGGVARSAGAGGVAVRIDRAPPGGAWLRGDQGINLPDTDLELPPLSETDRRDLAFVVRHADLVGYSFVQRASDVGVLRRELARLGRPTMGVVLKIETRRAFDALPEILLAALRSGPSAVMLARGDLAVEVGFERLAEVQEEMLWLCEAARLPAIWATQVLEGLAKSGLPTRAEVTDAAMGERAECVMLNKGPFLLDAVRALDGILRRMQAHQAKKVARLRHLEVAERFLERERRRRPIRR